MLVRNIVLNFSLCFNHGKIVHDVHVDSLKALPLTKRLYTVSKNDGGILNWKEAGIKICVPPDAISQGISCDIAVIPLLHADFLFPPDTVAVSGIYAIGTSCKLDKPLTIQMEHCVQLQTEDDIKADTEDFI